MSDDPKQLPLFETPPGEGAKSGEGAPEGLNPRTPLDEALVVYLEALQFSGASIYTIKAFRSDLGLLARWAGTHRAVGQFGTHDLNEFLHWMTHERGKPCSPKTYARRVTALKNFFGYLYQMQAIRHDPSNAVIQRPVSSPLPDVLPPTEIEQVLRATQEMRRATPKPDARPHLLVTLLLQTGIKKAECMALHPLDIDHSEPETPRLWVRYANPMMRYKERKILLDPEWLIVLGEYMAQRKPRQEIFDCTARNLEYVLRAVAERASIPAKRVSFESLRWTCALRDYLEGMDHDRLRQKLGVSKVTWVGTSETLAQLAARFGSGSADE
jgi:integrase/recombinase XerD